MSRCAVPVHQRQADLISEAALRRTPVALTSATADGFVTGKSRMLNADEEGLWIESPSDTGHGPMELAVGQILGVAFRRGHKKCVFQATILRRSTFLIKTGTTVPAVVLKMPTAIHQLQRRLFYRTPIPAQVTIRVDLEPHNGPGTAAGEGRFNGRMVDLSAGGVNIKLASSERPRYSSRDTVTCRFTTSPDQPAVEVPAQFRYQIATPDGNLRVGLQFVGLETSEQGRHTLERIAALAARFQQRHAPCADED